MLKKKLFFSNPFSLLISFLIIWFILFEYILPLNNFLPKPEDVYNSFPDLINVYQFIPNLLFSISAITLSILLSTVLVYFLRYFILTENLLSELLFSLFTLKNNYVSIILSVFVIYWFPKFYYLEFVFLIFIGFIFISGLIIKFKKNVGDEYISASVSLGLDKKSIVKTILFNQVLALFKNQYLKLNLIFWSISIPFEIIQNQVGTGTILLKSIIFRDLPTLFVVSVLLCLVILTMNILFKFLFNRFIKWE